MQKTTLIIAGLLALPISGCDTVGPKPEEYSGPNLTPQQLATIPDVINATTDALRQTGRYFIAINDQRCGGRLYVSPQSFKLSLKTTSSLELTGSAGGVIPISVAVVITPSVTATHKAIGTQQVDLPFDIVLKDAEPKPVPIIARVDQPLTAEARNDSSERPNEQRQIERTLITLLSTYQSLPHQNCNRYAEPITFTTAFQVEKSVQGDVKLMPIVTAEGKAVKTDDTYQTLEIKYGFSDSKLPKPPKDIAPQPLLVKLPNGVLSGVDALTQQERTSIEASEKNGAAPATPPK